MRVPVKSEGDAFHWAIGGAAVCAVAVGVGVVAGTWVGVAVVAVAVVGALIWELGDEPDRMHPLRDAIRAAPRSETQRGRRVLVIANETVGGDELRAALEERALLDPEVRVVCPILPSRAHYLTSDIDRELAEAHERLELTLTWAREQGIDATGRVSQEPPLGAAADALRDFPADEVIVSTHPPSRSRWLESGLVEHLRAELEIPVQHVVVDLERVAARR
ncbi:MAG TPA: hypothetical protein VFZ89_05490 [Solirubrobacteraceae bacterium]